MVQKNIKYSLLFLLFFSLGTVNVYGQFDELLEDPDYLDFLNGTPSGGSSSGPNVFPWNGAGAAESNPHIASIWEDLCADQEPGSSSGGTGGLPIIRNDDDCIPTMETIISHLSTFYEFQDGCAFVDNIYDLIYQCSDEVLQILIHACPDNAGIAGLFYQNIYPLSSLSVQRIRANISLIRSNIGDEGSQYYDDLIPFQLWLQSEIEAYLLETYDCVEFDDN